MAARNLCEIESLDRGVVFIFGGGTGAGAANLTAIKGAGVTSVAETATGKYTITLTDKWNSLMFFSGVVIDATTVDDWEVTVEAESVATNKTIGILVTKSGTATDLTTDEKLKFMVVVSNTSQPPTAR